MVNHALVTAPAFFIVAALAARVGGSEQLRDMGGIAFRAPVLASLFLIVALATLAMPGSSNFVGEFMILLGVFRSKLAISVIAFAGVVGAAVYALRLFITSMHNRVGPRRRLPRDRDRRRRRDRPVRRGDPRARVLSPVPAQAGLSRRSGVAAAARSPDGGLAMIALARRSPGQGPAHRLGGAVADPGAGGGGARGPAGRAAPQRADPRARGAGADDRGIRGDAGVCDLAL